jgi:hypothetical protein
MQGQKLNSIIKDSINVNEKKSSRQSQSLAHKNTTYKHGEKIPIIFPFNFKIVLENTLQLLPWLHRCVGRKNGEYKGRFSSSPIYSFFFFGMIKGNFPVSFKEKILWQIDRLFQ